MEKCTNHLCNCHRTTTSIAVQPFFTHYTSPNIVIVPTVSFIDCPPAKKTKCSVECQNSTHANNIPIIPDTHISCGVSSNNINASASINNNSKSAKIRNNSWASNYLQSIGQPELSTLSMSKKAYICIPDNDHEKKISKKLTNNEKIMQKPANKSLQPFEKEVKNQDVLHNRVTSLLSSINPGTSQQNLEKKANTQLKPILKNKTSSNANSDQNITLHLLKDKNINNLGTKRKHATEKKNICINEYTPLVKRVNKNKGDSVNDSNIQSKKIRDKIDYDGKQYKGKDNLSTSKIHCENDVFKDSNNIKNKPPKDYKSISSSSISPCKKKDSKHKSGLKKPSFKCTSNHKSEQNRNSKQKSYKSKNADITKVNQDSRSNKSKEKKILEATSFQKDKFDKHSESSTLDIKEVAKSTCKNQDNAGKTTSKKYVKSIVQTTDNFDFKIISKNNYKKQHEIEDLRIKLNRSHYLKKRDNLLVTVPNTSGHQIKSKQQTMKMPNSSKDPKVKKIKLIINLISNKTKGKKFKEENKINENRPLASVDLSFLDDFNVDDIVESLNYEAHAPQLPSTDDQSVYKTSEPSNPLEDINERVIDVKIESMCSRNISKQTENVKLSTVNTDVFNYCDKCKVKQEKLKDENEKKVKPDITKLDENSDTLIAPNKLHVYDTTSVTKADDIRRNAVIDKDIIIIDDMYEIGRENNDGSSKNTEDETKDEKDSNIEKKCLTNSSKINDQTIVKTEEITRFSIAISSETTLVDNNYIEIESTQIESPKCSLLTVKTSKNTIYDSLNKINKTIKQKLNKKVEEPNNKGKGTLDVDSKMDEQVDNMSCKTSYKCTETPLDEDGDSKIDKQVHNMSCKTSYKGTETQLDVDSDSKTDKQVHNMSSKTPYKGSETQLDIDGDSKMDEQVNNNMACKTSYKGTETQLDVDSDSKIDKQVHNMSSKTPYKGSETQLDIDGVSKMDEQVNNNMACKTSYKGTKTPLEVDGESKIDGQVHNMLCKSPYKGSETQLDIDGDSKMDEQVNNNVVCKTSYKSTETPLEVDGDSKIDKQVHNMSCKSPYKGSETQLDIDGVSKMDEQVNNNMACKTSYKGTKTPLEVDGDSKIDKQVHNMSCKSPYKGSETQLDIDGVSKMDEQVNNNMACKTSYKGTKTPLEVDGESKIDGQVHNMSCKSPYKGSETQLDIDGDSKMDEQVNNNVACKTSYKSTETPLDVDNDSKTDRQFDNMSCKTSNKTSGNAVEKSVEVVNNNTTSLHPKDLPLTAHLDTELLKSSKINNPNDPYKSKGNINQNMSSLMKAVEYATSKTKVQDQSDCNVEQIKKSTANSLLVGGEISVSKDPPNNLYYEYNNRFDAILKGLLETRMHQYLGIKYDITYLIHTGKYSKIFQCKDSSGKTRAVKVLKNSKNCYSLGKKKEDMLKSLQRDIPKENLNCVFLIDGFAVKDRWCFLMDFWPTNIEQVLKEQQKGFHICAVQKLARQLVSAVVVLRNNNIVHSDIKPGHILLNSSLDRLKLCGFDEIRYVDQVILLPNIGTASYRAPELILGHSDGFSIDVWSTALVIFEMATSKKLFSGIFNNDILYQQMRILGNIPFEMVQTSFYKEYHYCGTCFKRRSGYKGRKIVLISKFNKTPHIASTIFHAYDKYYGHSVKSHEKIHHTRLLKSLIQLLEQMLVLNPTCRIPIEFVYAYEFVFKRFWD